MPACRVEIRSMFRDGFTPARRRYATVRQSSLSALLREKTGGAEGIRTPDPHNAIVVLYQLSYDPIQSSDTLNSLSTLSKQNVGYP